MTSDPVANLGKLDLGLRGALSAFEEESAAGRRNDDDAIIVNLRFQGELAGIEALGFETLAVFDDQASGMIRFRDVAAIAAHPGVLFISAGAPARADLDKAAKDVLARASTKAKAAYDGDGLWHVAKDGSDWHAVADATGKDVIVAIIDSGIDYTHPMFMSQLTPEKKTRILSIWDQGLEPASLAECPDGALLQSAAVRYGVEYKQKDINDALQGTKTIKHKDCSGHGTHVAGIAAGGRLFPTGGSGDASKVGIAPEADIIVVKYIDVRSDIKARTASGFGAEVKSDYRFKDAILYCLRIARNPAKKRPIVINLSFGRAAMPGDGLDERAVWLDGVLDPSKPEDKDHVPAGAVVIRAMGNFGKAADRQHAKIAFAAAGEIIVPLELFDKRGGVKDDWNDCKRALYKPSIDIFFWYRAHDDIKFAFRVPNQADFNADVGKGGKLELGFEQIVGPPASVDVKPPAANLHRVTLESETPGPVAHPLGGTVERHHMALSLLPRESGTGSSTSISYMTGKYAVRIKAPADTEIWALCSGDSWGSLEVSFCFPTPVPSGVTVTNLATTVDPLGRNVITVASYEVNGHAIGESSSRGPMRDFTKPKKGPISVKPDLAAPGVGIKSAQSAQTEFPPVLPDKVAGVRFVPKTGTSMAAPCVAGVVALLLDKKPGLKVSEVRTLLNDAALTRQGDSPNISDPGYKEAFGDGMVHALASHKKA